jgi:hypothetical protein
MPLLNLKRDGSCNVELVVWRSDRLDDRLRLIPALVRPGRIGRLEYLVSSP